MKERSIGFIFLKSIWTIIVYSLKIVVIVFAWSCRLVGFIVTKTGEGIEKIIGGRG